MIYIFLFGVVGFIASLIWLFFTLKEYEKAKKIAKHWSKIAKAYQKDDFTTINKAVKKLKKLGDDDPLLILFEVEKYMYGKTVYKDLDKVVELLREAEKIKIPPKLPIEERAEKIPHLKEKVEKLKKVKKRLKKEKYLKKIKKAARNIWNDNEMWEVEKGIRRGQSPY